MFPGSPVDLSKFIVDETEEVGKGYPGGQYQGAVRLRVPRGLNASTVTSGASPAGCTSGRLK
jgi:hypothetical protein